MLSAIQTAFKILAGFVLVKVVALATGTEGIAQLGQFQNLVTVISILSGGMFYTGVTKLIAEHSQDRGKALSVIYTALRVSLILFACIAIVVMIWHDDISMKVLKDESLNGFVFALPLMVFMSVLSGLWLAVLNGFRRIRELVIANIGSSFLMILLAIAFALPFGKLGAYVSILAPPAIVLFVALIRRFSKHEWASFLSVAREQAPPYRELGRYALMGLVSAVAAPVAQMVMREYLVRNFSLDQAGIWQGVTRISEVYLVFITSSLGVYFLPKLAQAKNKIELVELLTGVLKLAVPVSLLLGVLIYLTRDFLIWLLFTPAFSSMRDLFIWQIAGDMVKILSWVFAYVVLVRGSAIVFIVGEIVFNITYPVFGMLFVPSLGLQGAVAAYGVNYMFYLGYVAVAAYMIIKKTRCVNE